jgi:hypothetical protein
MAEMVLDKIGDLVIHFNVNRKRSRGLDEIFAAQDVGIYLRCPNIFVSDKFLHRANYHNDLGMGGKAIAKGMDNSVFIKF